MSIQAVIFDLFGTLVPAFASGGFERSLQDMAAALGVDAGAFRHLWLRETMDARMRGTFGSIEDTLTYMARSLGATPEVAQVNAAARVRSTFYRETYVPRPDAVATLRALKARGLRLGLISDCSCEVPALWPETSFAGLIEAPVFSCVEGLRKPDPRLYRQACARLSVEPSACMYVADGNGRELGTAADLGMQAVLIAVPGEGVGEFAPSEAAAWRGPRVAALAELLGLLS